MSNTQTQMELPIDDAFIGRRVHQLMWDKHMTQAELGASLGMDQSTVAKRLRGKVGWPATLLVRTADVLSTSVAYLVGEVDSAEPPTRAVEHRRSNVMPIVPRRTMTHSHTAIVTPIRRGA